MKEELEFFCHLISGVGQTGLCHSGAGLVVSVIVICSEWQEVMTAWGRIRLGYVNLFFSLICLRPVAF